jgi:hypothetical protein
MKPFSEKNALVYSKRIFSLLIPQDSNNSYGLHGTRLLNATLNASVLLQH